MNEKLNVCVNDKVSVFNLIHSNENEMTQGMDIGEKMKIRAIKSYGVHEDFSLNLNLIKNDNKQENDLIYLWKWFDCN